MRAKYLSLASTSVHGAIFGAGAIHHVAHGMFVFIPFFAVAPVLFGNFEALEADFFAFLEAFELLIFADGEPAFDHHDFVAHQLRLESR